MARPDDHLTWRDRGQRPPSRRPHPRQTPRRPRCACARPFGRPCRPTDKPLSRVGKHRLLASESTRTTRKRKIARSPPIQTGTLTFPLRSWRRARAGAGTRPAAEQKPQRIERSNRCQDTLNHQERGVEQKRRIERGAAGYREHGRNSRGNEVEQHNTNESAPLRAVRPASRAAAQPWPARAVIHMTRGEAMGMLRLRSVSDASRRKWTRARKIAACRDYGQAPWKRKT